MPPCASDSKSAGLHLGRTLALAPDDGSESRGKPASVGAGNMCARRRVVALQWRIVVEVDAGCAGALQQQVPGFGARKVLLLVGVPPAAAGWAHEHDGY